MRLLQELSRLSAEANQLRMAVEEARAAAEEGRRGRAALQVGNPLLGGKGACRHQQLVVFAPPAAAIQRMVTRPAQFGLPHTVCVP